MKPRIALACIASIAWLAVSAAHAQRQVPGDGRLFERNTQIGGDSRIDMRINSPFLIGNYAASGNLRGGYALRSFSPISDPTAFRASLGSSTLSSFVRDSVSVSDAYNPGRFGPYQPYFDPARTAPTAGYLSAFGRSEPSGGGSSLRITAPSVASPLASRIDPRVGSPMPGSSIASPGDSAASSIFGVQRFGEPGATRESLPGVTPMRPGFGPGPLPGDVSPDARPRPSAAIDQRIRQPSIASPLRLDLNAQLRGKPQDMLASRQLVWERAATNPDASTAATPAPAAPAPSARGPAPRDPSALPGYDLFTDMQIAMSLRNDPDADWFNDMKRALAASPTEAQNAQTAAAESSAQFMDRVLKARVKTFVAGGASALNDSLLKAESLMQIGAYYDAAVEYERARAFAPTNPLPLIGRANAYIAAGEYASAANNLLLGFDRYPDVATLDLDLASLLGGAETIDLRRAELMRILERNEDARLRFLLGYLEYYGGDRERGLENLKRAAAASDAGSVMRRLPRLLAPDDAASTNPANP